MIKLFLKEKYFRVYLVVTVMAIEFLATTTIHIEVIESIWDKANHFSAFFVLYIFLSLAYRNFKMLTKVVLLLAFGLQIEIVQSFIDGRYFSVLDVVADSIGILVGLIIIPKIIRAFS